MTSRKTAAVLPAGPEHASCAERITFLEGEVRRLKATLAARGDSLEAVAGDKPVKRGSDDWMASLAPQDRRHFEKKLGLGKKP